MSSSKYIFATDVDGTLLMDNGLVHPKTLEAFKQAQTKNHIIVIATGRALIRTKPLLEKLPYVDYFVCNNGALVYDVKNDKEIYVAGINPQHYLKIVDFARDNNLTFKLHTNKDWIGSKGIEDQIPTILTDELDRKIRQHITKNPNDDKLFNGQIPTQLSINGSEEICKANIDRFKKWFEKDASVYLTNSVYIDVNPKNKSKWTGLLEIANYTNIKKENIVTFGDSGNDLEMLLKAKENGYALENSKPDLTKIIKPRIGSNNSDAIGSKIFEYLNK